MRGNIALYRAANSAAGHPTPPTLTQPAEFEYRFDNKSAITNLNGHTSDSGHVVQCLQDPGCIKASFDGSMVFTTTAPTGSAAYLLPATPMGACVYLWGKFRFAQFGGVTKGMAVGMIPFTTNSPVTADSGSHVIFTNNAIYVQTVTDGVVAGTASGPFTCTDLGQGWRECEIAIKPGSGVGVIRGSDGVTHAYTNPLINTYPGVLPTFEPIRNSTDWWPEFAHIKASSLAGMSAANLAYYNALLAEQGF